MLKLLRRFFFRPIPEIPAELWARTEARLPFLDALSRDERIRVRELARAFLASKQFHGARDFELNNEMLLSIALQAVLPVYRLGLSAYRGWVGIIIYSGDIVIPRSEMDEYGIVHEFDDEVLGEARADGPVLLFWPAADREEDGVNVVIHEFAHKLVMAHGGAGGLPPLPSDMSRRGWARDFKEAYEALCYAIALGEPTKLDPYAAEDPAEFFAVSAEAFFETPLELRAAHPRVHAQLARLFGLDPAANLDENCN